MGRGSDSFCRSDSRARSDQLECRADANQNPSVPRCFRESRATTSYPQVRLEGDAFFENGCMIEGRSRLGGSKRYKPPRAVAAFPVKVGTFRCWDAGIGGGGNYGGACRTACPCRSFRYYQRGGRMSLPAAIVLDRVTKVYDEPVVFDVSLDVQEGKFVTLLGPSGSGKTTILQMIGGFVQPTTGRIFFGGTDMTTLPPNKRPCNTIFQDLGLFPHMTVAENVAYGLKVRGVDAPTRRKRTSNMLGIVALEGFERRQMHQLSAGQRRRVALARALVLEPAVLLLDESLTELDERVRQQLRDEIGRLHRRLGATFLAVTHNHDEALSLSDRIAVLRRGRVEQIGTPRELFERPANAFVARFIGFDTILRPERVDPGTTSWRAVVAGRDIQCEAPIRRQSGEEYVVVLRPERIRIAQPDEASDLGPVTVTSTAYKGRDIEVAARLVDGQSLKFLLSADRALVVPEPGSSIEIVWQPMKPLLVPEAVMVEPDGISEAR